MFICNIYKTKSLSLSLSLSDIWIVFCPKDLFIYSNESFTCICSIEKLICSIDKPISSNDLLIRPHKEIVFLIWPLYAYVSISLKYLFVNFICTEAGSCQVRQFFIWRPLLIIRRPPLNYIVTTTWFIWRPPDKFRPSL